MYRVTRNKMKPPKEPSKLSRSWVYTLNNYTSEEIIKLESLECLRHLCGKEVGNNGTPHLQGYIRFKKPCRFSWWKNQFPRIHVEIRRGTEGEAVAYCQKDGDIVIDKGVTLGDREAFGNRTEEALAIVDEFRNGATYGEVRERHMGFFFFNRRHVIGFLHDESRLAQDERYIPSIKDDA